MVLSILFVSQAFAIPSTIEDYAEDAYPALGVGDEALDILNSTSNVHALAVSENGLLNESNPLDSSSLDDPGDQVKFIFDWGDGTISETDFVDSGTNVSLSHSWSGVGVYYVRVRAEDTHGVSSNWSEALEVTTTSRINRVASSRRSSVL